MESNLLVWLIFNQVINEETDIFTGSFMADALGPSGQVNIQT